MVHPALRSVAMVIIVLVALGASLLAPELLAGNSQIAVGQANYQLISLLAVIVLSGWLVWLKRR